MATRIPIPIRIPKRGLIRSVNREEVPADGCSDLENWLYRDDQFSVRPGLGLLGQDIGQRATSYIQYDHNDGATRTVQGTNDSWLRYESGTNLWISLAGGVPLTAGSEQQVFRVFTMSGINWLIGCNGTDPMKKWDGTSAAYANAAGSPPNSRAMMKLFDRIILLGLKSGVNAHPAAIDVSDNKNFEAGYGVNQFGPLRDCDGEIIGGEEIGSDIGAIYASDGIHLAISDGGDAPFRFERKVNLEREQGLAATLAIVRTGRGTHVYLAKDATLKEFNLTNVAPWGTRDIEKYLQDVINPSTIGRSWMDYDPTNGEILIMYPEKGNVEPNAGILIKERSGAFTPIRFGTRNFTAGAFVKIDRPLTIGDLPLKIGSINQTIGELTAINKSFIFGEAGGQTFENTGVSDVGEPISAFLETGLTDLGDPTREKTLIEIQHRFTRTVGAQTVTFKLGKSRHGEDRVFYPSKTRNIGNGGPYTTGHRKTSRFFCLRMEVEATTQINWKGSQADAVARGSR